MNWLHWTMIVVLSAAAAGGGICAWRLWQALRAAAEDMPEE